MPAPPVSKADLALLRAPTLSGFRGVFLAAVDSFGRQRWVGKVKTGGKLRCLPGSRSFDARVTASCVVQWYERTFGPSWREALVGRKRKAWRVWRSRARGGWCGRLYHRGKPVELIDPNDPDEVAVFATQDAARAALDEFSLRLTGRPLMRNPDLWRLGSAVHTEHLFTYDDWVPPPPAVLPPPPEPRRPHQDSYRITPLRHGHSVTVYVRGVRHRLPNLHASREEAMAAVKAFAEQTTGEAWPCRGGLWRFPPAASGRQVPEGAVSISS